MYPVTYLPVAESDLSEAIDYIANKLNAPAAARNLLTEYEKTVQRIAEFPYACELYRTDRPMRDEIRMAHIKNYILYYAVFPDRVEIRRFIHARREREEVREDQ